MVHAFIGAHAALGELGAIGFLWVLIEILNPTPQRVRRAKIVALVSVILLLASWLVGGWYYVNVYSLDVKPIIKEGPRPWAHFIFTETKEHVFMFLPFLALLAYLIIARFETQITKDKKLKNGLVWLCILIFLLAMARGIMGYIISSGARVALEARVL